MLFVGVVHSVYAVVNLFASQMFVWLLSLGCLSSTQFDSVSTAEVNSAARD
jgi:hypothetical protein